MRDDIHHALRYISAIEKQIADNFREFVTWDALSAAAAIAYGRCFGRSKARFSLPKAFKDTMPDHIKEAHEYVLAVRDKHIAHSENPYEHNFLVVDLSVVDGQLVGVADAQVDSLRLVAFSDDDIVRFRNLLGWLEQRLLEMYVEQKHVVLEALSRVPLEELAKDRHEPPYPFLEPDAHRVTRPR